MTDFQIISSSRTRTLCVALELWLAPENFDASGKQLRALAEIRRTLV